MLNSESSPCRLDTILMQEAVGSHVLLNPVSGQCFALDDIGTLIWSLCDGAHRVADIVAAIVSEYDAPVETVTADTLELLQHLSHEKLLREDR
jgi:hypothetical protein